MGVGRVTLVINVEIVQVASTRSPWENLRAITTLTSRTKGGGLIVFPEYTMMDPTGLSASDIRGAAEEYFTRFESFYKDLARDKGSCVAGHLFKPSPDGRVYNTLVLIDDSGDVIAEYYKTHLFDAFGYRESEFTTPGEALFKPVRACGVNIGAAICYEIRFPEIFRVQALAGVDLFIVPAGWYRGPMKEYLLEVLASARAQENTSFVVLANNAGKSFIGMSRVVDPLGQSRIVAPPREYLLAAEVDLGEIDRARRVLPVLKHRRVELYKGWNS